jgi:tetratricopeptide (TPR) repeat protein
MTREHLEAMTMLINVQLGILLTGVLILGSCASSIGTNTSLPTREPQQLSYVSQANQYAKDGLLREAVDAYKKAIAKEPGNLTAYRNLGIILLKAGDAQGAIANLEKSLPEFEDNFEANFYLGEAYRNEEKLAEAIYRYKKALKIQSDEPRAVKSLAWSYYKIRYYSEALNLAQKLQKISPNDDQPTMILARVQMKLKRENEALAALKKGLEKADRQAQPYFQSVIAEVLASQGKSAEALDVWRKALKLQPMLAGALLGTGRLLLEQGSSKEATDYLERAVHIKPKMYEGYYWLARSLENSNPDRALRNFNVFRKNATNDPEFIDLIQDTKKRTASLSARTRMEEH